MDVIIDLANKIFKPALEMGGPIIMLIIILTVLALLFFFRANSKACRLNVNCQCLASVSVSSSVVCLTESASLAKFVETPVSS